MSLIGLGSFVLQLLRMEKALSLAYHYLSFRPRTVHEVERYLQKKAEKYTFTFGEILAALEILKDQGFLNDMEFIKSFVSSRSLLKQKGKRMLELELRKLGVSQEDIANYFAEFPVNEDELAQQALKKKLKSLQGIIDGKKRFMKAISFLQRRGFSFETAKTAYLQLVGE